MKKIKIQYGLQNVLEWHIEENTSISEVLSNPNVQSQLKLPESIRAIRSDGSIMQPGDILQDGETIIIEKAANQKASYDEEDFDEDEENPLDENEEIPVDMEFDGEVTLRFGLTHTKTLKVTKETTIGDIIRDATVRRDLRLPESVRAVNESGAVMQQEDPVTPGQSITFEKASNKKGS